MPTRTIQLNVIKQNEMCFMSCMLQCCILPPSLDAYIDIQRCTIAYIDIQGCTIAYIDIQGCTIAYIDIQGCTIAYIDIQGCTIAYIDIQGCTIAYIDIQGCTIGGGGRGGSSCTPENIISIGYAVLNASTHLCV